MTGRYEAMVGIPPTRKGGWWVARVRDTATGDDVPTGHIASCAEDAALLSVKTAMAWNKPKPSWLRRVFGVKL